MQGYLFIPLAIAARTDLTPGHKLVMAELMRRQGDGTHCIAPFESIAKSTGMSRRQVMRIIEDLDVRKDIKTTPQGRYKANSYSVTFSNNRNRRRRIACESKELAVG